MFLLDTRSVSRFQRCTIRRRHMAQVCWILPRTSYPQDIARVPLYPRYMCFPQDMQLVPCPRRRKFLLGSS